MLPYFICGSWNFITPSMRGSDQQSITLEILLKAHFHLKVPS